MNFRNPVLALGKPTRVSLCPDRRGSYFEGVVNTRFSESVSVAESLQLILDTAPDLETIRARSGNAAAAREKRYRRALGDRLKVLLSEGQEGSEAVTRRLGRL